jgi:hypothetical protein
LTPPFLLQSYCKIVPQCLGHTWKNEEKKFFLCFGKIKLVDKK